MGHGLTVVMYHYIRDLPRTPFPRLKASTIDNFREQLSVLCGRFEMATLECALDFLSGRYRPSRDLCVLTFDDGLKEHVATVTPMLAERRLQGLFFVPTASVEEQRVLAVHKNHFLMAAIDFADYRRDVIDQVRRLTPETAVEVDPAAVAATYRWDHPEVAALKYLLNFRLSEPVRETILDRLFAQHLGDETQFARDLYVTWDEARRMQEEGMVIGGHSHSHIALATLDDERRLEDLTTCTSLLRARLQPQPLWPFSYPYGKRHSYGEAAARTVRELGYCCSFATEVGSNEPGSDLFALKRVDTNDLC